MSSPGELCAHLWFGKLPGSAPTLAVGGKDVANVGESCRFGGLGERSFRVRPQSRDWGEAALICFMPCLEVAGRCLAEVRGILSHALSSLDWPEERAVTFVLVAPAVVQALQGGQRR